MFVSGDDFTELFLQHSGLQEILKNVKNKVRNGKMYDSEGYSLGGIEGVGKYILDYSTLLTFGNTGNCAHFSYYLDHSKTTVLFGNL